MPLLRVDISTLKNLNWKPDYLEVQNFCKLDEVYEKPQTKNGIGSTTLVNDQQQFSSIHSFQKLNQTET